MPPPSPAAAINAEAPRLFGIDFSSRPDARKPVVVAEGAWVGAAEAPLLQLQALHRFDTLDAFGGWLHTPGPWVGGFDLPFGLPRELVTTLGWPTDWAACMDHYATLDRAGIRDTFAAFCAARPVGAKFAHRACDGPAGSSPSMKWVNPPVAFMLHAGVPLLRAAGLCLPAHAPQAGDASRVALEAYPGLLARAIVGRRSYKSDDAAKQTPERLIARQDIVDAVEQGRHPLALRVRLRAALRAALAADPRGDTLDALLCLVQAAWAARQPGWGLPAAVDPLEGWILGA